MQSPDEGVSPLIFGSLHSTAATTRMMRVDSVGFLACKHHDHVLFSTKIHLFSKGRLPARDISRRHHGSAARSFPREVWSLLAYSPRSCGAVSPSPFAMSALRQVSMFYAQSDTAVKTAHLEPPVPAEGGPSLPAISKPAAKSREFTGEPIGELVPTIPSKSNFLSFLFLNTFILFN